MKKVKLNIFKIISILGFFAFANFYGQDNPDVFVFPSAKNICIEIKGDATEIDQKLKYSYSISSLDCSVQKLWICRLAVESNVSNIIVPTGWHKRVSNVRYKIVSFSASSNNYFLDKNEEINSLSFVSTGLPIISNSYSYGFFPTPTFPDDEPGEVTNNNIYENCVIKRTLAPKTIPNPFDPLAFVDSMIEMGDEADALGWLGSQSGDDKIWFDLKKRLREIQKSIKLKNYSDAIIYLEDFISNVDHYHFSIAELISSEGYALLFFNGKYLLDYVKDLEDFWGLKEKWNIRK